MIDSEAEFYRHGYAAVHRGIDTLSAQATEEKRRMCASGHRCLLMPVRRKSWRSSAARRKGSIWSPIAGVTAMCGRAITSSSVRWSTTLTLFPGRCFCARVGAELRVIPLNPDGTLQLETLPTLFDEKTRLLAITHVSNVLGTENPLAEMITLAHQHGAKSAGGWRLGGDASSGGCSGAGLRLLRVLRA